MEASLLKFKHYVKSLALSLGTEKPVDARKMAEPKRESVREPNAQSQQTLRHHASLGLPLSEVSLAVVHMQESVESLEAIIKQVIHPSLLRRARYYRQSDASLDGMAQNPPDIMLINCKRFDGKTRAFIEKIRHQRHDHTCAVPIVAVTQRCSWLQLAHGVLCGVQAFLLLPVSCSGLRRVFRAVLNDQRRLFLDGECFRLENTGQVIEKLIKRSKGVVSAQ